MSEPVLSEEEKKALLDGVSSGAVEVLTGGEQQYASVRQFEVNPRSRIKRNSFPRLQVLNEQLADRMKKHSETSLQCEVTVEPAEMTVRPYSEICARYKDLVAVTSFSAAPLEGRGGVVVDAEAIHQIVEGFFGGQGKEPAGEKGDGFSAGEVSVCRLFASAVVTTLGEAWESCVEMSPEIGQTEIGMDLVDIAADSDRVLTIPFALRFAQSEGRFELLLPMNMLANLLPIFEGQKGERDAAEDARWERVIRAHLPDTRIRLTGNVGRIRVPLATLNGVKSGDILRIENPRSATVVAGDVPVVVGNYGVHAGQNAVETTAWA